MRILFWKTERARREENQSLPSANQSSPASPASPFAAVASLSVDPTLRAALPSELLTMDCEVGGKFTDAELKYFKQVEASEGFDVDPYPCSSLCGAIRPHDTDDEYVEKAALCAIQEYNKKSGECVSLHRIVKVNAQWHKDLLYYMTLEGTNRRYYEAKVYYEGKGVYRHLMSRPAIHYSGTPKCKIAAPDPEALVNAVVQIFLDKAGDLHAVAKSLKRSDFNFTIFNDPFFEVVFAGGRIQPGTIKPDEGKRHPYAILDCEPKREVILSYVVFIQKITNWWPFVRKNLENVLQKFLHSLELFEENERKKLAIFIGLAFSENMWLCPKTIFQPLFKDNIVAKELALSFITDIFKEYLVKSSLEGLISILKQGKVEDSLREFFPSFTLSPEGFSEHFTGIQIMTAKQNIASPAAFADAVVQIYMDNTGDLEAVAKSIELLDLNVLRYGDTFFEVVFTGARTQPGTIKPGEGERHSYSILDCEPKREAILPCVIYIWKILRWMPILMINLRNVFEKFLQSLELFEANERKKLAIFTALAFSQKVYPMPGTVFQPLLEENFVAKGLVLLFITDFFKEYLVDNSLDDLISILKQGQIEDNLLEFFPSAKRSAEGFSEHFNKEGLVSLVKYNEKKMKLKLKYVKSALTTRIREATDISEVIETMKQRVRDDKLPDIEVVRILWDVIMDAVQWSGENQQQSANAALCQVKTWAKLLNAFCVSGKLELELIYKVQMRCYGDAKFKKLFPEIIRSLYEQNVLAEDTIIFWSHQGTNPKGRKTFVKALEPFVNWVEESKRRNGSSS